jgi:hypothetical protein
MQGGKNPNQKNVTVASGTTLHVEKVGTIYFEDEETKSIITLQEYHHVSGLSKEMISLGKLIEDGWKPDFTYQNIFLQKEAAKVTCKRSIEDGMYYLQGSRVPMNKVNAVDTREQGGN